MESQLIQKSLDSTERRIRKRIARFGDGLQFLGYKNLELLCSNHWPLKRRVYVVS